MWRLYVYYADAAKAVRELQKAGVPAHDISVLSGDDRVHRVATGAGIRAAVGGVTGLLTGLELVTIRRFGPTVSVAGWLAETAAGAAADRDVLSEAGISGEEVHAVKECLREGATLVTARVSEADQDRYAAILDRGAIDVPMRIAEYHRGRWTFFDPSPYTPVDIARERNRHNVDLEELLEKRERALVRPMTLTPSASRNNLQQLRLEIEADARAEHERLLRIASQSNPHWYDALSRTKPDAEFVDVSVFGPKETRPGERILIQVLLHWTGEHTVAMAFAKESDPEAQRRGVATLVTEIRRQQRVEIFLEAPGLTVRESPQQVIWNGTATACPFLVETPATPEKSIIHLLVQVRIDSVPVGTIIFTLKIVRADLASQDQIELRGESANRHRYAFLSYTNLDRAEVLKTAQTLRILHIDFFQDLLSTEPGAIWEPKIFEEINRSDLFLLFWSSNASKSKWVLREAEYALRRRKESEQELPDITPVILEVPVPEPPDSLKEIHFNDPIRYIIACVENERAAREADHQSKRSPD
jgi:hypothetical protein